MTAEFKSLKAAADYLGNGSIEVPIFESEITDAIRRDSVALQRIPAVPATGHPHRYLEQTAVAQGGFADPRNITSTASGPTRVERPAFIKAITAQTNIGLFDKEVTQQQGQFASVVAKDIDDVATGIIRAQAAAIWNGNDTSLVAPTTLQYMGFLAQITQQFSIAANASIVDGLKTAVATMMSNQTFKPRPTAIYANPLAIDLLEKEAKSVKLEFNTVEVVPGVTVKAIATQAGNLPIISDAFLPIDTAANYGFTAPANGTKNYYFAIVTESELERAVVSGQEFNPNPRIFQLGLQGGLSGQYVGVMFDTVIAKGAAYNHAVVCVNR
ncbi:hypothetical protein JFK97_06785 [Chromobacterium phragmitis]|uniref:hypothetical protein n=1 Tax=Chromobacterium amazonense TaxID=1382803 RepID=UPI0021B72C49|nr:hypothetical protein [Chromobacterium amazonense]MBM2884093.1 hypothetical protein [Chromobacterium amazonense]